MKSTLTLAEEMSQVAWQRKENKSNPWGLASVRRFVTEMNRAGYVFEECNYPFDGCCIRTRWDQLWAWCESISQNERDTLAGR